MDRASQSVAICLALAVAIAAIMAHTPACAASKNELTETIVTVGEVRKTNRAAGLNVTNIAQKTLTTRDLSVLFGWISELLSQQIIPRTGNESHFFILEYDVLSKHSSNFCRPDELVFMYKAINDSQFILEEATVVNRNKFCS